ncbi:MAG: hypothetical protein SCI25_03685 [Desulfuromonadales bacterium]|nr:hypothetical protein [Desulfuromonadales bacterium]MDW7757775.1 hypothetical protein [Desulfuromonadales bacterium]
MKKTRILLLSIAVMALLAAGCKNQNSETPAASQQPAAAPQAEAQQAAGKSGTVVETMNAAGYTYVQVDTGSEKIWAAAPEFAVKVGDAVVVPEGMPMENYHSKTLDRNFDLVYFVDGVLVGGAAQAASQEGMPAGHPDVRSQAPAADIDLSGITKAEGGQTVAEVYAAKADLAGKTVNVRGKVVKFSPQIMGKNWIHLQDGSGAEGTNDLTITTAETANVGDTVLISGALAVDKDFGYGYQYAVIVEDAKVTVE